jgi:signal transduction histidine kinase
LTLIFFFIKEALVAAVGIEVPFLFSLFIVIICAWFGGFGPGILATILSGSITYYFYLEPKYTILGVENISNAIVIFVFFLEGLFISMMSESHRKSDIQKSEFIGVISHELKNPLTSIKGYAELIQRLANKNGEQKFADFALRIDQQVKQVIEMINEMLDITKIEAGRLTYQDETFNVTELVKELVGDLQVTTDIHKIHFIAKESKMITGDRYRIGQVITNLISNAIKYAPNTKKVNVIVENKRKGVVIAIHDFGPGIAKEDQVKLFEPFFRAKNTQSAKGTGIGLFISSRIVERHKGKLWVESKIGKGAVFYLWLPTNRVI